MFFVTQLLKCEHKGTVEHNLRIGGFKSKKGMMNAVRKCCSPCLVRDEHRKIVGQTIGADLPMWIAK
jgi:hypothetical protein